MATTRHRPAANLLPAVRRAASLGTPVLSDVFILQQAGAPAGTRAFTVTFTPEPETQTAYSHFTRDCGWTAQQARELRRYAWFVAKVELHEVGIPDPLSTQYLGACCYTDFHEFILEHAGDYYLDMLVEAAEEAHLTELAAHLKAERRVAYEAQMAARATPNHVTG